MTRPRAALAMVLSVIAAAALTGCSKKDEAVTGAPTIVTDLSSSPPATAAPDSTATSQPTPATTGAGTTKPAETGPKIVYFQIKSKPACPSQGPETYFPGSPIVLEWKVTGAAQVTISIDGPGVYDTYPAEHSESFPFSCSGAVNSTQEHTYLLRTVDGGTVQEATVEGKATVH